ncbi:EamA family transporter [Duganella sp. FT92W]|uniref:EamA family transporter n=1 Tax=Pseudoduganella rivuli TaxID=2666085 RepID=A0A7X2IPM0_9BURK|nr:EamA family transporter [Pseudoduganella rivuli]
MDTRKTLDGQAIGMMALLCLTWSLQQIALKATAPDVAPLLQIALRSGIAAVLVALLMAYRRERFTAGALRPGMLAGFLFAFEYLLLGEGLRHTTAGHAVVLLYTGPIFAALGLHWKLPSERLAPGQWIGIALAFGGIAVTFIGRQGSPRDMADMLAGDLLCVAAGAAWGATTVVIRCTKLSSAPATETLLYQLLAAPVMLLPAAAALGQLSFNATPLAIGSLAFQSVVVSFASFLAWFAMLRRYLASRLGVFSFLTPLFAVALGGYLLGEHIEPNFIAGALLVLAGIVLVSGYGWIVQGIHALRRPVPDPEV